MSSQSPLVTTYAEALLNSAKAKGTLDVVAAQVEILCQTRVIKERLASFLQAPNIELAKKEELIHRICDNRFEKVLGNFLLLLLRRGRQNLMSHVLLRFMDLWRKEKGMAAAVVTSSHELSPEEKEGLKQALSSFMKLDLDIKWKTDPSVIGGIRFQCGDTLIDHTLKTGLGRIEAKLLGATVI